MLSLVPGELYRNRKAFEKALKEAAKSAGVTVPTSVVPTSVVPTPVKKAILSALSERDEEADICTDSKGRPEADTDLRDYENIPLKEDIRAYFEREVLPHVPDAWINKDKKYRDKKDGRVGIVGYEINFNRYFYTYEPPRPLEVIDAEIKALEAEILEMLREVTV